MKIRYLKFILFFSLLLSTGSDVYANQNTTRITLTISDTSNNQRTNRIVFSEGLGYTTGLDRGYDAGAFGGDAPGTGFQDRFGNDLAIYTLLVNDNLGTELGFTIQSLPYSQIGNMVIPLGINPSGDDTITITATITDFLGDPSSFPSEHNLILEDRKLVEFTELQELGSEYVVPLTQDEPELGRFYLHTTTETILSLQTKNTKKEKTKKSKGSRIYGCKDKKAKNYIRFSSHKQSKCNYEEAILKKPDTNLHTSIDQKKSCNLKNTPLLKKGMIGKDIHIVQECLVSLDYNTGPIDGIFGDLTYAGVISYQTKNRLLIDGIIGKQTVNHLNINSSLIE